SIHEAWRRAVLLCLKNSRDAEARALSIEICFHDGADDRVFRNALNAALAENELASVDTVARTIFPRGLWNPTKPRQHLYDRYLRILPKLRTCPLNRRGIYFERLIQYPEI